MLNEKLERYYQLQQEIESREAEMKTLKEDIIEEMKDENISSKDTGNVVGKIVDKTTFKYNDEISMITYLKEKGLESFVNSKINTTNMNKELKKKGSLYEDLKPYVLETSTSTLSVKAK